MTESDPTPSEEQPHDQDDEQDQQHSADADVHTPGLPGVGDHQPGPLYQLCVAPDCPYDFAYRFDGSSTHHFHYVGPPRELEDAPHE